MAAPFLSVSDEEIDQVLEKIQFQKLQKIQNIWCTKILR